jgi:hypothetical protein
MLLCYGPQDGLVWSYSKGIFPYHEKQTVVLKDVESALQEMLQRSCFSYYYYYYYYYYF